MRKIKLPEFDSFEDAYSEEDDRVESVDYLNSFKFKIDDEETYICGFVSPTCYYDDSIVTTEDFTIRKRSKENLKRIYQKAVKQLCKRYEEWVLGLFEVGENK